MSLVPLPDALRAAAVDPPQPPVPARDAATIVVVRDGDQGVEAYLMRRQTSMAFAAGMYVFPGGGLTTSDVEHRVPWVGPDAEQWGARFRCDPALAKGLVVAAVRETFEETGILLAGPDADTVVSDTSDGEIQAARLALDTGEVSFAEFLSSRGLVLRADLLGAWAHWITPEFEPRRYDTRFFVAALPAGQRVGEMSRESDHAAWVPLSRVLAAVEAGEAAMMPPTVTACREVAAHTAATVVAASQGREFPTVLPRLVLVDDRPYLETDLGESP
ncbi:NUDIX hydrolase [Aeromicrobium endophyticum]|uniref:NUDIX hydrolase n=1 Tax=Aeromicrobium endophyticum TaxID=2292704 RepID=A0A371PCS6_9ACTN|nr:NUDIX domain-containing protein [Aeromicrobium endophyticum]REK73396.1 NUDIX hydrolase [Aeromicrobium endophyticum]